VLLQVILTAGTRLTTGVRALESLDTGVDPLVTLKMTTSGETTLANGADVRLRLALGGASRAVLALGHWRHGRRLGSGRGRLGTGSVRVLVAVSLLRIRKSSKRGRRSLRNWWRTLLVGRGNVRCRLRRGVGGHAVVVEQFGKRWVLPAY